jgi:crotonobetainyl-CoA:carnitine CoA-transferase CaiB-like acyl-CoA transferase
MGYTRILSPERRPFPTLDGHICVMPYVDKDWQRTFELIGREDLKTDARFADVAQRTRHIGELYRLLAQKLRLRTTEEWVRAFDEADIPAMRLHTPESLLEDPHLNEIGFFGLAEHPSEGTLRTMAVPTRWSESPPDVRRLAPRLGEHSVEVLREAGYAESVITDLLQRGVTCDVSDAEPLMKFERESISKEQ